MADLANPRLDVARVHPAVAVFFEDTASLDLRIRSRWRFPFSIAWWLARPILRWIGQLTLPRERGHIATTVFALDPERDGRADVRAVVREYVDGSAVMQVVAYATWERAGTRYMSAAFPLPGGHIMGILRLDAIGEDADGRLAVALTSTKHDGDDAGIWYALGSSGFALPIPLGERLALWAPEMECAPKDIDADVRVGATIVGRHEQRLFGVRLVTHDYGFRPLASVESTPAADRAPPPRT